jgi:hypothetical protein
MGSNRTFAYAGMLAASGWTWSGGMADFFVFVLEGVPGRLLLVLLPLAGFHWFWRLCCFCEMVRLGFFFREVFGEEEEGAVGAVDKGERKLETGWAWT